nr:hypothetical protein [Micromonospora viridifaciens]
MAVRAQRLKVLVPVVVAALNVVDLIRGCPAPLASAEDLTTAVAVAPQDPGADG